MQDICNKVCQHIQVYVTKLKNGENIEQSSDQTPRTQSSEWSNFFSHMDSRSRSQRDHYQSFQEQRNQNTTSHSTYRTYGFSGQSFGHFQSSTRQNAYPHHQEARRWLRQAKADLEAANKALSNPSYDAFNWICFKCHQAGEKSLKALLYNLNAQLADQIKSHDLRIIVRHLGADSRCDLLDSIKQLEDIVQGYNRMRYPDRLSFPRIPADVYDIEAACDARRLASLIVEYAETKIF